MESEQEIRAQICDIGRRIYEKHMAAANDGNISIRIGPDQVLCTPTGISKGFLNPDAICRVDLEGNPIGECAVRPSSEIQMHLRVYRDRPDIKAVVHAHPIYATTFAVAKTPLSSPIMPEAVVNLGCVPVAGYARPSTMEIPDSITKYLPYFDAVLLEKHGALTYADSLLTAYMKMESLEFYARLLYQTRLLGGAEELSKEQVRELYEIRKRYGLKGRHPADFPERDAEGRTLCMICGGGCGRESRS